MSVENRIRQFQEQGDAAGARSETGFPIGAICGEKTREAEPRNQESPLKSRTRLAISTGLVK